MDDSRHTSREAQPTGSGRQRFQQTGSLTRRAFLAQTLVAAGSLLVACQQPTSPSRSGAATPIVLLRTPEPTPTQATGSAADPAGQAAPSPGPPKPGGSVVWAAEADPLNLDPHTSTAVHAWGDLVYQSLVMFDASMEIVPCLAEAWRLSDDRLTWTFTLRQGVTFHDGSPFEAEDVRFWFERLTASETAAPYRGWFSQIASVTPKGRYEVELTLRAPHAPLLSTLAALRGSAMAPRRWLQQAGSATKTTSVGSGPFKIAEYVPGSHIRYVKHPDYWEKGLPYLDEVRLEIIPDEAQRVDALQAGRVTYAMVGPAAAAQLASDKRVTVLASAGASQQVTILNAKRAPFDDVRVRQAIALAVDRNAALQQVLGGAGNLTGPLPTGHGNWPIPPDRLPYRQDVETARLLLDEAGYPDGFEATIRTTPDQPALLRTATVLASQLQAIGVTLHVEQLEWGTLAAAIQGGDFELYAAKIGVLPDPDQYASLYAAQAVVPGAPTFSAWQHDRYAEIVEHARTVMDPGARKALYDEAATILLDETPALWWFTEHTIEAIHPSMRGYRQSFTGRRLGLKQTWLDR